jgi:hypothetical protein
MTFTSSSEAFRNSTSPLTQAASIRNSNKNMKKKSPFAKLKKAFGVDNSTSTNSNSKHQHHLQVSPSSNSHAPLNGVAGSPMSMSSLNGGQIAAAVVVSEGAVMRGGDVMIVSL